MSDDLIIINDPNSSGGGGGATTFVELTDTPSTYVGQAGKFAKVNAGATGLEFDTVAGGGDLLAANNLSDVSSATTSATNLGLGTLNTPEFTDVTLNGGIGAVTLEVGQTIASIARTGVLGGGLVTIVSGATFRVAAGTGIVLDPFTDPNNPTWQPISWVQQDVVVTTPAQVLTYIYIDKTTELVVQRATPFTSTEYRDLVIIAIVITLDQVNVTSISPLQGYARGEAYLASDLAGSVGVVNKEGNNFVAASTNLTVKKFAGTSFLRSGNVNTSDKSPNMIVSTESNPATFNILYSNGAGGFTTITAQTVFDSDLYDDLSGTLATMPNNSWVNHYYIYFPSTDTEAFKYGETTYSTEAGAKANRNNEPFNNLGITSLQNNVRTILTVKKGETNLAIGNDAFFSDTGLFGLGASGGGTGGVVQGRQSVYENSIQPQTVTTAILGADQVKDGTGVASNAITQILDNSDNVVQSINSISTTTIRLDTIEPIILGATVAIRDVAQLQADGFYDKADASAEATTKGKIGFVLGGGVITNADTLQTTGVLGGFTGLVVGTVYWLSETAGLITATAPTATTTQLRKLGVGHSTTELNINIDSMYMENT